MPIAGMSTKLGLQPFSPSLAGNTSLSLLGSDKLHSTSMNQYVSTITLYKQLVI